jgi:hypothetical protein
MKDETYVFISDVKEKGSIGRSARHRKTHTGKGGRVRLPSDNLSKKELEKMNGECKSYRLNDPVKWDEFKSMPDDIKATYIKLIRQKFNPPNTMIAQMMGVSEMTVRRELKKLGLEAIQRSGRMKWDKEGFYAWMHGDKLPTPVPAEEPIEEPIQEEQLPVITSVEPETYVEDDLPFEKPDLVTDADVIGCLEKRIDDLTAVLEKSEAENGWLRNECDNQRMQIRILEAQMEVVRMIFGGKNHG